MSFVVTWCPGKVHIHCMFVTGYVIMHPAMSRPVVAEMQPLHTNISHLEPSEAFQTLFPQLLAQRAGNVSVQEAEQRHDDSDSANVTLVNHVTYHWRHVFVNMTANIFEQTVYIMVIKHTHTTDAVARHVSSPVAGRSQLVYHRLDLLPLDGMCAYQKQLASTDTSALFLSAASFLHPFDHLSDTETKQMVKNYLAYLRYDDVIGDPDDAQQTIRRDSRKDVAIMSQINAHWVAQFKNGALNEYIVRRYMATRTGALYMFPGTLLNKHYDASKRDWFRRALQFAGRTTFTAPYLDNGGAGYTVTISYAIFEGRLVFVVAVNLCVHV